MFCRCAKWFVVLSLILTMGGHWAALQTVAWVGMAVEFSETEDLATALSKTFDGKHPCRVCQFVREGKAAEKKSDAQVDLKKLDSFIAVRTQFFFPPLTQTSVCDLLPFRTRGDSPPTPPPLLG